MFTYFPNNYRWSLAVLRCLAAGGLFGEIDWACSRLREAASDGPSGDIEAWHHSWSALAEQVKAIGEEARSRDHRLTAAAAFLRSSSYFQWAEGFLDPDDPRASAMYQAHLDTFRAFGSMRVAPLEFIEVPFEGTSLFAYVVPRGTGAAPAPAVVLSDGLDANKEEMFYVAQSIAERGMTCLVVDGPGQGQTLRHRKLSARFDSERWFSACIDALEKRSDVDPARIGIVAASLGGYYAPRAAAFDERIKACAVMGAVFDGYACMARRVGYEPGVGPRQLGGNAPLGTTGKQILRILGTNDWDVAFERLSRFRLEGVAFRIRCPLLIVHGERDRHAPPSEAQSLFSSASSADKTLRVFTEAEGGSAHVNLDRPEPALSMVCDWLADRLNGHW